MSADSPCRLLSLPAELRVIIYEFVFQLYTINWDKFRDDDPLPITLSMCNPLRPTRMNRRRGKQPPSNLPPPVPAGTRTAILRTCQEVQREAQPVLHDLVRLEIWVHKDEAQHPARWAPLDWADQCGFLKYVRNVELKLWLEFFENDEGDGDELWILLVKLLGRLGAQTEKGPRSPRFVVDFTGWDPGSGATELAVHVLGRLKCQEGVEVQVSVGEEVGRDIGYVDREAAARRVVEADREISALLEELDAELTWCY